MTVRAWSDKVAGLAVDALIDASLLQKNDFDLAKSIVGEEILVRLSIGDYPPIETVTSSDNDDSDSRSTNKLTES